MSDVEDRETGIPVKLLKACALEYRDGMEAPVVRAFGEGNAAELILKLAEKHGIPVRKGEAESLLNRLKQGGINSGIPAELYSAVARIYSWLLLKEKVGENG